MTGPNIRRVMAVVATAAAIAIAVEATTGQEPQTRGGFSFRSSVELINVTATVSDRNGRFVSGLRQEDFEIHEDDQPQEVSHFSAERVPVSLGIALDSSGSMVGDKMEAARKAIDRFLYDLLDPADEIFVYRFGNFPVLEQSWTTDRDALSRALRRIQPRGATAMYDAVAEAVPLAQSGRHRKKALVVISDGNDTNSETRVRDLTQLIRETEVLVYAIGIDTRRRTLTDRRFPRLPIPTPFPFPGFPGRRGPSFPQQPRTGGSGGAAADEPVNQSALRELTDDSGGRTEIVRSARDLDPATTRVADELSQQYYLGYPASTERDGRWHTIRVEVRGRPEYRVRARRGYVATP
jgi:Ca-activated chloride channel family protein